MNLEELLACGKVLSELSERFAEIPENADKCIEASIYITIANTYVASFAQEIASGKDPYDAMVATAIGHIKLPERAQAAASVFQLLAAKPKK